MSSEDQPFVSVLTPVYNMERHIGQCIESVLAQTHSNWEYIIVNNCSTDGTLEIANAHAAKDSRIRVYSNSRFLSVYGNHNEAIRLMSPRSVYCKTVSADDWIYPDCIRQMVSVAEANPTVGIVCAYQINVNKIKHVGLYPESVISGKELCRRSLLGGPYVLGAPTSHLYRASLLRSVPAFYVQDWGIHADTATCYEYLDRCDFGFVHQVLSFERLHPGQISEEARRLNTYIAEHLLCLSVYGAKYLSEDELRGQLKRHLTVYYKFLARNLLKGREKKFWDYHKSQLMKAGFPFRKSSLTRALVAKVVDHALNPKRTIEGLRA